jgi:hypothetical protein
MVQTNSPNDGEDGHQPVNDPQPLSVYRPRRWPMVVTVTTLFAIGGVGVITFVLLSRAIPDTAVRYGFVAQNVLSLFVFLAVFAQACVYWGQRNLMKAQWLDMESSLERTDRIIEKMGGQLEAMQKQEGHLLAQAEAAKTQAEAMQEQRSVMGDQLQTMRDSLAQNQTAMEESWKFAHAQGLATCEQLIAMRDQAFSMKAQLAAIHVQNATLEKSIDTAEMSSIYAQRAYLTATVEKITEFRFYLRIENSGQTPANDVHVAFSFGMREKPPYDVGEGGVIAYDADWAHNQRLGLIAPRSHQPVITPKSPDPFKAQSKLWDKWKLSQVRYYVWGRIFYEDIFNKKRHTDFCFFQGQGFPDGYPSEYGNSAI